MAIARRKKATIRKKVPPRGPLGSAVASRRAAGPLLGRGDTAPLGPVRALAAAARDEAFRESNGGSVVTPAAGTMNIVVYDGSDARPPVAYRTPPAGLGALNSSQLTSLTFWWKAGGMVQLFRQKAQKVIAADSWRSALTKVVEAAQRGIDGRPKKIGSLQFWGHGAPGAMLINDRGIVTDDFSPGRPLHPLLKDLADNMSPQHGSIWFRGCNTFQGDTGQTFASAAAGFFGVPVVGHTYIIWVYQSGTYLLKPGQTPEWSKAEGGGNNKLETYSGPRKPNTVSCLRFYPPKTGGDFLSGARLSRFERLLRGD
jgi:hypothetical protein